MSSTRKPDPVNIAAAKARLPELVERAAAGETILLARRGKPKAKLVPLTEGKKKYVYGAGKGKWRDVEAFLAEPLPEEEMNAFYEGAMRLDEKAPE